MIHKKYKGVAIISILSVLLAPLMSMPTHAAAPCGTGKSLNIVAHEDDDIIFMNPDILSDIQSGRCVETMFMTAGDAGVRSGSPTYWQYRENGALAAYAQMAGVTNSWSTESLTVQGHSLLRKILNGNNKISLVFMRLPDGGFEKQPDNSYLEGFAANSYQTIRKLWVNDILSIAPVDGSASYTRQGLIDTITQRMTTYGPDLIRTQDTSPIGDDTDHNDHHVSAYFAEAARQNYIGSPYQYKGYQGYQAQYRTANVTGSTLDNKRSIFVTYDAQLQAWQSCTTTPYSDPNCLSILNDFIPRQYVTSSGNSTGAPWTFSALDGDSTTNGRVNGNVGRGAASVTYGSNLYNFYYDQSSGDLRYSKSSDGSSWNFGTLDGNSTTGGRINGDVGQSPTVVVQGTTLQLFYYDAGNGNLRHAWSNDGTTWSFENLDGDYGSVAGYNSNLGLTPTAVMLGTSLQVFYYDAGNGNMRHAWTDATGWHFEILDGDASAVSHTAGNIGSDPTAINYGGNVQLFYYDAGTGNLRHAWTDATGWHFENLDGDTGSISHYNADVGSQPSATIWSNQLQVFYKDNSTGTLRHAWTDATGWHFENLIGDNGSVIPYSSAIGPMSAAIVSGSALHVFAYEGNGGNLLHIWHDGTKWRSETLDGRGGATANQTTNDTGVDATAIEFNGKLRVFYYDVTGGNLRQASSN